MITLAITGGIGSGKTTVLNWFESKLIPTINADKISRDLVAKGQDGLQTIVDYFGDAVLNAGGELDRDYMRQLIFTNPEAKTTLENILHPLIRQETQNQLDYFEKEEQQIVVVEIPLLAETGKPDYIDLVWAIACSAKTQLARVKVRKNMSEDDIITIIKSQATTEQRAQIANTVINSDVKMLKFYRQLETELARILNHAL